MSHTYMNHFFLLSFFLTHCSYQTFLVDVEGEEGLSETASAADNVEEVWLQSGEVEHKLCHPTQSQVLGELGRGESRGNETFTVDLK